MRRRVGLLVALGATLAVLAGCAGEEGFSDAKVNDAAKVEDGFVAGDPFCEVSKVLNDAGEIDEAGADAAIITSAEGNVGVEVVPPFPPDCEKKVRKGLDRLDPKPKE
jgi:hypothetical protein